MMIGGLVTCSGDTSTGSPFIQEIEHLSDEGADVLALNTAATFKMLGLIWQSLISSVPLHVLNLVERKRKRCRQLKGEHVHCVECYPKKFRLVLSLS